MPDFGKSRAWYNMYVQCNNIQKANKNPWNFVSSREMPIPQKLYYKMRIKNAN